MSKNFRVRVACGVLLFAITLISIYTFNGIPFRFLVLFMVLMAAFELASFFEKKKATKNVVLAILQLAFLAYGALFFVNIDVNNEVNQIWYLVIGTCGYDVFAYLGGKAFGGKWAKSKPFPKISKGKTWEGTIVGIVMSVVLVGVVMALSGGVMVPYLLCGPLALCGDLYESYMKRQFKVKDSNEIVIKNKFLRKIELLVGGNQGHGGFLDRVDSLSFVATILFIILAFWG